MKRLAVLLVLIVCLINPAYAAENNDPGIFAWTYPGSLSADDPQNDLYPDQGNTVSSAQTVWKNDTLIRRAYFTVKEECTLHLEVAGDSRNYVQAVFLEKTSASLGMGDTEAPHAEVPDRRGGHAYHAHAGETVYLMVRAEIPSDAQEGMYEYRICLDDGDSKYELPLSLQIRNQVLPESGLITEYWLYPYSALRWYDILKDEQPFSRKHCEVLRNHLKEYRKLGMKNITVSIADEPWGHQVYDDYPSMVRWNRDKDGYLFFEYDEMDAWIELCMECGIDEVIDCFGILPFDGAWLIHEADGSETKVSPAVGSDEWRLYWSAFLYSFADHMKEKGWLDKTYIAVDEGTPEEISTAVSLAKEICGETIRFSAALDELPEDCCPEFERIAVSIAAFQKQEERMKRIIDERKQLGLKTLMYNCSTNYPNAFALSQPDESVWTIEYLYGMGFDGYLRWALDAWTENPYENLDWQYFEAGDTFLMYPDAKDAENPVPVMTYRLEMIEQGKRNVSKLQYLQDHTDQSGVFASLPQTMYRGYGNFNAYGAMCAKNESTQRLISVETARINRNIALGEMMIDGGMPESFPYLADPYRSVLARTGIDISWDGAYLGYQRCSALVNIACMVLSVLAALMMHSGKRPLPCRLGCDAAALIQAGIFILHCGSPMVLIDHRTWIFVLLAVLSAALLFIQRKTMCRKSTGENAYV